MKSTVKILAITLLAATTLIMSSCAGRDNPDPGETDTGSNEMIDTDSNGVNDDEIIPQGKDDDELVLLTTQELLEYIGNNNVGLKESDFEGIDINDFIKRERLTAEKARRYNLKKMLESYKTELVLKREYFIMAGEVIAADSTDQEYKAFLDAYFNELDIKPSLAGSYGIDRYDINKGTEKYSLYIGKTKDLKRYKIDNDGTFETCQIYIPAYGDGYYCMPFCYGGNNKFFLAVMSFNGDREYMNYVSKTFVNTKD
jgi:hypothetical protein